MYFPSFMLYIAGNNFFDNRMYYEFIMSISVDWIQLLRMPILNF